MKNEHPPKDANQMLWPINFNNEYAAIALAGFLRDGNQEAALMFIRGGAQLNSVDDIGRTSLHWAAFNGHNRVFQEVFNLYNEASINYYLGRVTSAMNLTPIHYAFMNNRMYVINEMFKASVMNRKFDIISFLNKKDVAGRNPIHWACSYENHEDAVFVVANWAASVRLDISTILTSKTNEGFTPLHLALLNNFQTTASFLLQPIVMSDEVLKEVLGIEISDKNMLLKLRVHLAKFGVRNADLVFKKCNTTALHTMAIADYAVSCVEQGDAMLVSTDDQRDDKLFQFSLALEKMRQAANLAELCF